MLGDEGGGAAGRRNVAGVTALQGAEPPPAGALAALGSPAPVLCSG